jgi:hypothetical protein
MRALDKQLKALPMGNIAIHFPKSMKVGDSHNLTSNVGIDVPKTILRNGLPADQIFEASLRISSRMMATLDGPGFKITPITPQRQTIAAGFENVWDWTVEATDPGDQELQVALYALIPNGPGDVAIQRVDSYAQKLIVGVRPQTWPEYLDTLNHETGTVKTIAEAGAGIITLIWTGLGFIGIRSLFRRRREIEPQPSDWPNLHDTDDAGFYGPLPSQDTAPYKDRSAGSQPSANNPP